MLEARPAAAISDPLPVYREGLATKLRAVGWHVDLPDCCIDWLREGGDGRSAVLITVGDQEGISLVSAARRVNAEATLCALLTELTTEMVRLALIAGANVVLARNSTPSELIAALTSAHEHGQTVLPAAVAQTLAARSTHTPSEAPPISEQQVAWLREISRGATVAALAHEAGYSERQMSRMLHDLYARLHARNREEALVRAVLWGLLHDHHS